MTPALYTLGVALLVAVAAGLAWQQWRLTRERCARPIPNGRRVCGDCDQDQETT